MKKLSRLMLAPMCLMFMFAFSSCEEEDAAIPPKDRLKTPPRWNATVQDVEGQGVEAATADLPPLPIILPPGSKKK
jgi:hypothetical protein